MSDFEARNKLYRERLQANVQSAKDTPLSSEEIQHLRVLNAAFFYEIVDPSLIREKQLQTTEDILTLQNSVKTFEMQLKPVNFIRAAFTNWKSIGSGFIIFVFIVGPETIIEFIKTF